MKETWISAFIDDELALDEKIGFVEAVHNDRDYKEETVDLLRQEGLLRGDPASATPRVSVPLTSPRTRKPHWWQPMIVGLGTAAALLILWINMVPQQDVAPSVSSKPHRFVIYRPDTAQVEISGSFTNWRPVGMQRIGRSGYWETHLELAGGEHRFAYILDGSERIADPTILVREKDDFGGENSIIHVSL